MASSASAPVDREGLRRLATEATPGPWRTSPGTGHVYSAAGRDWTIAHTDSDNSTLRERRHAKHIGDAAFIAAASPSTVLALLDALDERDALLDQARRALSETKE